MTAAFGSVGDEFGSVGAGEAVWDNIKAYMDTIDMKAVIDGQYKDENYKTWLKNELGLHAADFPSSDTSIEMSIVSNALGLVTGTGREFALRSVTLDMAQRKMRQLTIAQTWRDWDVFKICYLEDESADRPFFIIDGHIRIVARQGLLGVHYRRAVALPKWLLQMASHMTIDFLGRMSRTSAVAKAFAVASSLQEGTTKLGWLEVTLQVVTSSSGVIDFGSKLQQKVFEIWTLGSA